jgi:hypothetical protein
VCAEETSQLVVVQPFEFFVLFGLKRVCNCVGIVKGEDDLLSMKFSLISFCKKFFSNENFIGSHLSTEWLKNGTHFKKRCIQ